MSQSVNGSRCGPDWPCPRLSRFSTRYPASTSTGTWGHCRPSHHQLWLSSITGPAPVSS